MAADHRLAWRRKWRLSISPRQASIHGWLAGESININGSKCCIFSVQSSAASVCENIHMAYQPLQLSGSISLACENHAAA